jgi:hypothetical protein
MMDQPEQLGTRDLATGQAHVQQPDAGDGDGGVNGPLLPGHEAMEFQRRWEEIQTGFVDEPRRVVEQADELVAGLMKRLAESFAGERERLEAEWDSGADVSTEDLRVALQRYRSFFRRLLTT